MTTNETTDDTTTVPRLTERPGGTTLLDIALDRIDVNPANARKKLRGIDELAESFRTLGQIVPAIVIPSEKSERYTLVSGHRRLAALKAAKMPWMRALLVDGEDQAVALVMITENESRDDLTVVERARAYQHAFDLGLAVEDVAVSSGVTVDEVAQVTTVHGSAKARAAAEKHDLTLDQALVFAEFDKDKASLAQLTECVADGGGGWDHLVATLRRDRQDQEASDKLVADAKAVGVPVLTQDELHAKPKGWLPLGRCCDGKGKNLTPADHVECPGRAVALTKDVWRRGVKLAEEYCLDAIGNGHRDAWGQLGSSRSSSNGSSKDAKTDAVKEAESAERRKVSENNRAMDIANEVRREFLTKLITGRSKIPNLARFVATYMLSEADTLTSVHDDVWQAITGVKMASQGYRRHAAYAGTLLRQAKTDADFLRVQLGMICAAIESTSDKTVWRTDRAIFGPYLSFLADAGYTLSDVEAETVARLATKAKAKR